MRFINHLEAEIIELRAENARLKVLLYGSHERGENETTAPTSLPGGFRPRHQVAMDIKARLAKKRREEKDQTKGETRSDDARP